MSNKLFKRYRRYGFVPFMFYVFELMENRLFEINRFYFLSIDESESKKNIKLPAGIHIEYHDYSPDVFNDMEDNFEHRNAAAVLFQHEENLDDIKIVFFRKHDKIIAGGYLKLVDKLVSPSGYKIFLGPGEKAAWMYGAYVHPEYRGRGFFYILTLEGIKLAKSLGVKHSYCEVHYLNRPSFSILKKIGFKVYKNIYYIRIFKKKFYIESKKGYWA